MELIKKLKPPPKWKVTVIVLIGIFTGLSAFIFHASKASSYLSDKPETCINCHVMAPQYITWSKSSHENVATCNDCHVPHNNFFNKFYFKGKDGFRHAKAFSLRTEPQVIYIKEEGAEVVHQNCIRCHENQINDPKLNMQVKNRRKHFEDRKCWECHKEVPHGRVNSLSSTPNAIIRIQNNPVPDWLKEITNKTKN